MRLLRYAPAGIAGFVLPQIVSAQFNWPWISPQANVGTIFENLAQTIVPIANTLALLVISLSAIAMVFSQSENTASTARKTLIGALLGLAAVWISRAVVTVAISGGGTSLENLGDALEAETLGLAGWLRVPAAVLAVLMLIISGIRAIISFGSDDGVAHLKRTAIAAAIAIPLISVSISVQLSQAFNETGSPAGIIAVLGMITRGLLSFVGIAAVVVIVIAGIMMIVNIGNDAQYERAKGILIRVVVGLLVIGAAWALLSLILLGVAA